MTPTPKTNLHTLPDRLLHRAVKIHVVGCGGSGSHLLPRLAQLHKGMVALGHPKGLDVTVWDGDTVSESNTIRQNFFLPDIGHNKASVMINRLNMAFDLDWEDKPHHFSRGSVRGDVDFIIGCVDSKKARREIDAFVRNAWQACYWIDAGNESSSGQVIVGQFGKQVSDDPMRLPLVTELYPEIVEGDEDNAPSCSARESIFRQGLATNAMAASWIYAWIAEALRHGSIGWSGVFFNLETGRTASIPVSREAWDAIIPAKAAICAKAA